MWRDRKPTDREVKAVTSLQAAFRGHLVRKILNASKAGKQLRAQTHTQNILYQLKYEQNDAQKHKVVCVSLVDYHIFSGHTHTHNTKHLVLHSRCDLACWRISSSWAATQICIDEIATLTNEPWRMEANHIGNTQRKHAHHTHVQTTFQNHQLTFISDGERKMGKRRQGKQEVDTF